MAGDAVAAVKERVDIVDVVGQYVRLERRGRRWMALCPFHAERTPSFSVSRERQAWYCFGCQEGGDVIAFVEKVEHLDFREALELLAERAGVELSRDRRPSPRQASRRRAVELHQRAQSYYEHVLWATPAGEPGRRLLRERGVPDEVARRFGIGFAPTGGAGGDALVRYLVARRAATAEEAVAAGLALEAGRARVRDRFRHRLVFPIRDERGTVVAFGGRALDSAVPKYLNSPSTVVYDKSSALFGLDLARDAIAARGSAVVVEGYFDVVAAHRVGVTNAVATGGTALTPQQARVLARHTRQVVLCFDADDAGRAAASRAVDVLAAAGLHVRICLLPPGVKDPDELVRADPAALARCLEDAAPEWEVLLDLAMGGNAAGSLSARRAAAERAIAVLARIPEAATRALYVEAAARRLGIAAAALASDVERARSAPRTAPRPMAVPLAAATAETKDDDVDPAVAALPPSWEAYLGRLCVQHPHLARELLRPWGLRAEEMVHPVVARVVELTEGLAEGAPFPLQTLPAAYRSSIARHLFRPVPELDDPDDHSRLPQAVADCIRRTRLAALDRRIATVRSQVRSAADSGDDAEVRRWGEELAGLSAERQRMRLGHLGTTAAAGAELEDPLRRVGTAPTTATAAPSGNVK